METQTIGQLAGGAGVRISTVRFYERKGLLKPDARTRANYRTYTARSAQRLHFIRAAQAAGFKLKDVRDMLALTHSDDPPCAEVASLIEHRLEDVRQRVKELRRVEKVLAKSLTTCCQGGPDWCSEIERLKGRKCTPAAAGKTAAERKCVSCP